LSLERSLRPAALAVLAAGLLAAGCRQNMHDQAKYEPYEESDFFPDGQASRPLPAGTVARGFLREDAGAYTGIGRDGQAVTALPFPVTREVLRRGEERYGIFCASCHDRAGTGRGMIVQRGFTQPSSYHIERLRNAPVGYFYNVITEGFGVMPSYAHQLTPEERWAVTAYIRALQLSQSARLADLSPEERARLDAAFRQGEQGAPSRRGRDEVQMKEDFGRDRPAVRQEPGSERP
jgi:mono/diheme cytochrome c family protein